MGWRGTGSRLGLSRGLSEPARPRDRPKISDTFSPKPHTDSAGGDTENIFFLFLPPHPPTSLPAWLPPPPPALAPPSPAACPCPTPSSVPWGWGAEGGREGGWARRPGRLGLCPSHLLNSQGHPQEAGPGWQKRSASWAHDATLSLWHFPPACHLGGLVGFSGQAVIQSPVLPQGRQWALYPRAPRGGVMGQEYARADASVCPLRSLLLQAQVPSPSPPTPAVLWVPEQTDLISGNGGQCRVRDSKTSSLSSRFQLARGVGAANPHL